MATQPAAQPAPLLRFLDPWEDLNTRDISFDKILKPSESETFGLEILRDMDALRRSTCFKQSSIKDAVDRNHVERIARYLAQLAALRQQLDTTSDASGGSTSSVRVEWSSPLSGRPAYFYRLTGLAQEQALATFQYGGALRALAFEACADLAAVPAGAGESGAAPASATGAAEAAAALRLAAGVYDYLSTYLLPQLAEKLPADRPAELVAGMSKVMSQVCLAEAQSVTAHRAGQRPSSSPALTSALHAAAAEAFEGAARTLKEHTGSFNVVSDRLRRFLAISGAVARARALRCLAEDLRSNKQQAGQAEAACVEAASLLTSCVGAADVDPTWRALISAEAAAVETVRQTCQRDRERVYYQAIARSPPDLPPGKMIVKPIDYTPVPAASSATDSQQQAAGAAANGSATGAAGPASPGAGTTAAASPGNGSGAGTAGGLLGSAGSSLASAASAAAALFGAALGDRSLSRRKS